MWSTNDCEKEQYPDVHVNRARKEDFSMAPQFRRIVTGHDAEGKSIVVIDGPPSAFGAFWQTEGTPAPITARPPTLLKGECAVSHWPLWMHGGRAA